MQTLIAEDVLLLLLDDRSGRTKEGAFLDVTLGGALLAELALAEAVAVPGKAGVLSRPKVEVRSAASTTDPILRSALDLIGQRPRTAQDLVKEARQGHLQGRLGRRGGARGGPGRPRRHSRSGDGLQHRGHRFRQLTGVPWACLPLRSWSR